jgi:hypothetical protein
MNKKAIKIVSLVTFILFLSVGVTWAQGRDRGLSKHERHILKHEQKQLRHAKKFAAADGRISPREGRLLGHLQNRLARDRRYFTHNDNRRYDCRNGCRYHHEHWWPAYYPHTTYRPYGYYYSRPDYYRFSGTWLQPGGFFSISVGGS